MVSYIDWFLGTLWQFLPAYFANAAPVLIHGGGPVDGGQSWLDGRRILGDHKTFVGSAAGVLVGTFIGVIQGNPVQGFLFSTGAIAGDLLFAFIKRRLGLPPGSPWVVGDQIGFILVAILLGSLVEPRPTWAQDIAMVLTTIPLHYATNVLAWALRWKKNPW
jgi:CDP-2,3-bis-(O-geranylgeranyl)-sn-glycerol synthase